MYQIFKDFAGPVATIIASITAALITLYFALRQMRIAKQQADTAEQQADTALDQLRYNIFEKRVAVYEDVKALIRHLVNTPKDDIIDASDVVPHYANMIEARFFFSDDICSWMDDLQRDCQKFLEMRDTGTSGEYHGSMIRLVEHLRGMPERFETELGFRQLTRRTGNQRPATAQQHMGVNMADPNRDVILKELDHIQAIMGRFDTFFFLMKQVFFAGMVTWVVEEAKDSSRLRTYYILVVPLIFLIMEISFRFFYWTRYARRIERIRDHLQGKIALPDSGLYEIAEPRRNSWSNLWDARRLRHSLQFFDFIYYGAWAIVAVAVVCRG